MNAKNEVLFNGSIVFYILCLCSWGLAQDYATFRERSLVLDNGVIERNIVVEDGTIFTQSLKLNGSDINFIRGRSSEFSVYIDGKYCDGRSGWDLLGLSPAGDDYQGNGATMRA